MELSEYINKLKNHMDFGSAFIHYRRIPPLDAGYGEDYDLDPELSRILREMGIDRLYSHQSEALGLIRRGENVIIATPTASGKSMIFNLVPCCPEPCTLFIHTTISSFYHKNLWRLLN